MAVPSSGTLSLLSLAKEKVHDDYTSSNSVTGPISLKDLTLESEKLLKKFMNEYIL